MWNAERPKFSTPEWECGLLVKPSKPSRAAEYIAVLYFALVLGAPWLIRDALILTPPSLGVEVQMVNKVSPPASDTPTSAAAKPTR